MTTLSFGDKDNLWKYSKEYLKAVRFRHAPVTALEDGTVYEACQHVIYIHLRQEALGICHTVMVKLAGTTDQTPEAVLAKVEVIPTLLKRVHWLFHDLPNRFALRKALKQAATLHVLQQVKKDLETL